MKSSGPVAPYIDSAKRCLVRLSEDGSEEKARMEPGADGFAIGYFEDGIAIKTEMPNILLADLTPPKKAMKAMKAMKAARRAMKGMKAMKKRRP